MHTRLFRKRVDALDLGKLFVGHRGARVIPIGEAAIDEIAGFVIDKERVHAEPHRTEAARLFSTLDHDADVIIEEGVGERLSDRLSIGFGYHVLKLVHRREMLRPTATVFFSRFNSTTID